MAKVCIVAAVLSACTFVLEAQSIRGAFGYVNGGVAIHFSPSMQQDLRSPSLLGMDLQLRSAAVVGANGLLLFSNRVLVGGSATGYRVTGTTGRGESELTMAGAFLNVGYLLSFSNRILSYPFVGLGVNTMILKLTNGTNDATFAIWNQQVGPDASKKFASRGVNFDAGYSIQFLTFPLHDRRSHGGIVLGAKLGALIFAGLEDWHESSSEQPIPSLAQALSFSPYVRLTIGLGSFKVTNMRMQYNRPRYYRH